MASSPRRDLRVVAVGDLERGLYSAVPGPVETDTEAPGSLHRSGRLDVDRCVRRYVGRGKRVLVLTQRDLHAKHLRGVFGHADRARGVAVVSVLRLALDVAPEHARQRLANVIAHELAHLDGLRHCRTPGCLLNPARSPEDVDRRSLTPCGRCPNGRRPFITALAALFGCLVVFAVLDGANTLVKPPADAPFACRPISDGGPEYLWFRDRLVRPQAPARCRTAATAGALNRFFRDLDPPEPRMGSPAGGRVIVACAGVDLLEVERSQAAGWTRELRTLLRGKGTASEICPACHIDRVQEVNLAARGRRR